MSDRELGVYINDHLTGATGGVALARRAASNSTDPERRRMWEAISEEIAEDRATLARVRDMVGVKPNRPMYLVGWAGEKVGRLKPNGEFWRRKSELGQFLELEMLFIGVTGKLALWKALERLGDARLEEIDFAGLVERAEAQRTRLEQFRISLVPAALG